MKSKGELVQEYIKRYSNDKTVQFLNFKINRYPELIKKWILGRVKNPYYPIGRNKNIQKGDLEYYALLDWIIPSKNFDYKISNMNNMLDYDKYCSKNNGKIVRSSIIPFVKINGENYWLLGSFQDYTDPNNLILADFGGSCEKQDETKINPLGFKKEALYFSCKAFNCAFRELKEESRNVLTEIVKENIQDFNNVIVFEGTHYKRNEKIFFMFLFLDYDKVKDVPEKFKNTKETGEEKLGNLEFYKQKDIFSRKYRTSKNLTDLVTNIKNKNIPF
jgi:hypothetical protein